MTKGSPGSCHCHHPPATVAEIEQEADWQGNSAQNRINALFHKPSVTQSPSGISKGLENPFCPHGITNRDCGIGKMLHLAIINYLEANEKNYKISAKKQKQGKEPDGIKTLEKTKKKKRN